MAETNAQTPILELQDVKTHFHQHRGWLVRRQVGTIRAVDGVTLSVARGEVLGLVGESGCGKSTLARTIMRLEQPTAGRILLEGQDLARASAGELRRLRPAMQMVFQDPYASLNPRMTVFDTLAEPLRVHRRVRAQDTAAGVRELMERVGLAPRLARKYPHEFSGGQRQRIAIARALALQPRLLLADEPVSALDVSIQAQILNLLARLTRELGLGMVFIAHDLSVVKHVSDRIAVMYLGKIVELGEAREVIEQPLHPYTRALISAVPLPDPTRERARRRIVVIGDPPSPLNPPSGCPFRLRCPYAIATCAGEMPPLDPASPTHHVACIRWREIADQA